jgi:PEP-CTERM motif-containing protein
MKMKKLSIVLFAALLVVSVIGAAQASPIAEINISLGPWGSGNPALNSDTGYFKIGYATDPMLGLDPSTLLFDSILLTDNDAGNTYIISSNADDPQFDGFVSWLTNGMDDGMGAQFQSGGVGIGQDGSESGFLNIFNNPSGDVDLQEYTINSISLLITDIGTSLNAPNTMPYIDCTITIDGDSGSIDPVPEPTTILLLGSGLIGLAGFRKKFKKV